MTERWLAGRLAQVSTVFLIKFRRDDGRERAFGLTTASDRIQQEQFITKEQSMNIFIVVILVVAEKKLRLVSVSCNHASI